MTSPTQKGEREEALEYARALLEAYPNGCILRGSIRADRIARALLSLSKAEGEMREALKKRADACPECRGVGKILVSFVSQYDGHVTDTRVSCPSCRDLRTALTPKEGA